MPVCQFTTQRKMPPDTLSRRSQCACGSGRKYKHCCMRGGKERRIRARSRRRHR